MTWFWYFTLYSFLGFLLEVAYARFTRGRPDRKCLLVLPLCPVYGLGALAILLVARWFPSPFWIFALGGSAATAVEYGTAFFYEEVLRVSFWDYRDLPGSLHGRVCPAFSLAWGLLALGLVYGVHPLLAPLPQAIPAPVSALAAVTVGADLLLSSLLLRHTGDRTCLQWYRA